MTDGRRLAKNTLWNLVGQVAPVLVALVAIPPLIHTLGKERFGVLTLAWAAISYFGLFDLGLGRALTHAVGAALGARDFERLESFATPALRAMFALGVIGGVATIIATPWIVRGPLAVPISLQHEAEVSFYLLGASLPFVLSTAGLRGVMEAHQDFGIATAIRIPFAAWNYLGPLLVVAFSHSLVPTVASLVVGRVAAWGAHVVVCVRRYDYLRRTRRALPGSLWPLLRVGGWMSVSNIISPLMYNVDRFFVGALLSMTAVTYYVTAFELGSKLLLIPTAVLGVLFPALATSYVVDRDRAGALLERATRLMAVVMFVPVLLLIALAHVGLSMWVGPDMANVGAPVLRWLALGVFANSLAQIPFAAIQAAGRPDLTAKLHLVELPFYIVVLVWLTKTMGVEGVALAWTIRMVVDCTALFALAALRVPGLRSWVRRPLPFAIGAVLLAGSPGLANGSAATGVIIALAAVAVFGTFAWRWGIGDDERQFIESRWRTPTRGTRVRAA